VSQPLLLEHGPRATTASATSAPVSVAASYKLADRVQQRRHNFTYYQKHLSHLPGLEFMPEADYGTCTRWLTCLTIDPAKFGCDRETIRTTLATKNIETRPVWKPMHLQPIFQECESIGGDIATDLFDRGLCLPSGSNLTDVELDRVIEAVIACHQI
jgi:dTDP-4-amino-4,6-dideoxygalactose transaminase